MGTMSWEDGRGTRQTRQTNPTIETDKFRGTPGFALLVIAANRHLSVADLERLLGAYDIERSQTWIRRRRWLFSDPDAVNAPGKKHNADGLDERAVAIMRDNPALSVRQLSRLLKERGINRGKDWVMRNRCR